MHAAGLTVSVDVADWSPLWDLQLIGASSVDLVETMSTYTDDFAAFESSLAAAIANVPLDKLVIGLETVKASNGAPYNASELQERFDLLAASNITKIGLWRSGIPDLWWSYLNAFASQS